MKFLDIIKQYGRCTGLCKNLFPPVICKDGTFMSIQASQYHHCYPQKDLEDFSEYESFEIRTDSDDGLLAAYKDDEYEHNYVDLVVVDALIEKHGGLDMDAIEAYLKEN